MRLPYGTGGQNPPLLIRADGTSAELKAEGAVLGQFPQWLYKQSEFQMRMGDKVLLFTDGLVEACNADEESFGEHNLIRIARENPTAGAEKLMGLLIRAAWQHGGEHFEDDASLIVLKANERATLGLDGGIQ